MTAVIVVSSIIGCVLIVCGCVIARSGYGKQTHCCFKSRNERIAPPASPEHGVNEQKHNTRTDGEILEFVDKHPSAPSFEGMAMNNVDCSHCTRGETKLEILEYA
eukprot:163194_1